MNAYVELIKNAGLDIVDYLCMGDYQGDLLIIVKKENQFGMISTGYGSCSGCDALQSCDDNPKKLKALQKRLCNGVIWKDITSFIKHLRTKEWQNEYYYGEQELPQFVDNVIEKLLYMYLAKI